ncbi:MAG: flavocytochrome c [Eubacteriales bacterium]|nr:flavocytochrome c [Eubacteriales bacterium]
MKKNLKKIMILMLVLAFLLSACSPAPQPTTATTAAPTTAPPTEPSGMKPGKYIGEVRGYNAMVKVETEVDADKILSVTVVDHKETLGIGTNAVDLMPQKFVDAQSVAVDVVTGATATSLAITFSVRSALEQAGADMATFTVKPAPPTPKDAAYDAGVVVIGGGIAGLTSALQATLNGAKVILVEKMDVVGGNSIRSSGGFNVAGHPQQIEAIGLTQRTDPEQFIEFTMKGGHQMNDPALVRYMVENSAAAFDWLATIGMEPRFGESKTGGSVPGNAPGLVVGLEERFKEAGGVILLGTKVTEIVMKDGAAAGVIATSKDGGTVTVSAKAVVLAAGGFGANLDMVTELDPSLKGFVTNNSPSATGDGIALAQNVGAAIRDLNEIQIHPTVHNPSSTMVTEGARSAGAILINTSGKRFTDEVNFRDVVSAAILEQDQGFAYILMNQDLVDTNTNIQGYYNIGLLKKFDTLAEVAAFMKIDAAVIQETVDTWNSYVANKNDPEFKSQFDWRRDLSKGPYYTIDVAPGIHHTMGGVVINTNGEVISTTGDIIPGLFACGEVTGGVHGGNRVGGNAITDCLVYGMTAGINSAAYVKN